VPHESPGGGTQPERRRGLTRRLSRRFHNGSVATRPPGSVRRANEGGADAKVGLVADQRYVGFHAEVRAKDGRAGIEADGVALGHRIYTTRVEGRLERNGFGGAVERKIAVMVASRVPVGTTFVETKRIVGNRSASNHCALRNSPSSVVFVV
jgi:hypothetical protein